MDRTLWRQVNIVYSAAPSERERQAATHLSSVLPAAEADGLITDWWFLRKGAWRIRYRLSEKSLRHGTDFALPLLTASMTWTSDIYEPETHAFGGEEGMDLAHTLFHADSRHLLAFLTNDPTDCRERSLLLLTAFMRAAGLDFNEQGDVWARIAQQRAPLLTQPPDRETWKAFTHTTHRFLTGTARPQALPGTWLNAFEKAGERLRELREHGRLTRGIRAVCALHTIFHWNRLGIPATTQAALSQAATDAVFGPRPEDPPTHGTAEFRTALTSLQQP